VYICCCNKESLLDRFCFQATDRIPALFAVVIADPGGCECVLSLFTTTLGNADRCWKPMHVWNLEHKSHIFRSISILQCTLELAYLHNCFSCIQFCSEAAWEQAFLRQGLHLEIRLQRQPCSLHAGQLLPCFHVYQCVAYL
jgi:hypothetical protein